MATITNQVIYEPLSIGNISRPDATITALYTEGASIEATNIAYWVLGTDGWPQDGGVTQANKMPQIHTFWQSVNLLLSKSVHRSGLTTEELQGIWINLEGLGQELCETFLPNELRAIAQLWRPDSTIFIGTNEKWIPWELIHDGEDFWGNKFNLARIPKVPGRAGYDPLTKPMHLTHNKQVSKVVNVIGGKLGTDSVVERIRKLFGQVDQSIVAIQERKTLREVLQAMEFADLIHFTCHCHVSPDPSFQLADEAQSLASSLNIFSLRSLQNISHSIIFANACTSAGVGSLLGELRNFGWEFYKKGSDAYVGTLGLVPTKYAIEFAELFYHKLLAGATVGEALRYAKLSGYRDNPFWLLYCLYGNPFTRKVCPIVNRNE